MGDINYEMRRAQKHGMSLEEWMTRKQTEKVRPQICAMPVSHVYHHTNILFTHLIWNSGFVDLESEHDRVVPHPFVGKFGIGGVTHRRKAKAFPRLAWFTSNSNIPRSLENGRFLNADTVDAAIKQGGAIKLNRMAIEFSLSTAPEIVPWKAYRGYNTSEGRELNETAVEEGDDPDEWYVSETPVSVLKMTRILYASNWLNPVFNGEMDVESVRHNMRNAKLAGVDLPADWEMPSWQKQHETILRQLS